MTAAQLETESPVLDVELTPDEFAADGIDPVWADCMAVIYGVIEILETLKDVEESSIPTGMCASQAYADELLAAFEVGQKLLNHDDKETIRKDVSQLDDDLLVELRGTVGYVAPHVGVDLELPTPTNGGEGHD